MKKELPAMPEALFLLLPECRAKNVACKKCAAGKGPVPPRRYMTGLQVQGCGFWEGCGKNGLREKKAKPRMLKAIEDVRCLFCCIMNKHVKKPRNLDMYKAILTLRTVEECMDFFDDLCTVTELQSMEQRYQVAALLDKGLIYNDILEQTGASSATISRVNRSLQYGAGGYAVAFKRMEEQAGQEDGE